MNAQCKIVDGEIVINIESLLTDDVVRELSKRASFSQTMMECLAKALVTGEVAWDDNEFDPWTFYITGREHAFERARQVVASIADDVAMKLIADLTKQRDRLFEEKEALQKKVWAWQEYVRDQRLPRADMRGIPEPA